MDDWRSLGALPASPPPARALCERCRRPVRVCWCASLPERLAPRCRLVLLQHPAEERRTLKTAPMLALGLRESSVEVRRGKRFAEADLARLVDASDALLLYPSRSAVDVRSLPRSSVRTLVLIDGTWPQARAILASSPALSRLRHAKLVGGEASRFVIRTQPAPGCLSTLETAAEALAYFEDDDAYRERLRAPLAALCRFQLENGAVEHAPKDKSDLGRLLE